MYVTSSTILKKQMEVKVRKVNNLKTRIVSIDQLGGQLNRVDVLLFDEYYDMLEQTRISLTAEGSLPYIIDAGHGHSKVIAVTGHHSDDFQHFLTDVFG